ncbi:hypothetical protein BDU57DRAFT_510732 [Ampelomyces quisqualis]|uniref:Uncharacterized protein n=1 Tax=Ampelomyces quisqualis TaxID=50730 RepID=A0A6A5R0Z5_AMPQU|nr:hypothetical protein BDU57DRAFT_510732 [Ampelomyces quisqualis]
MHILNRERSFYASHIIHPLHANRGISSDRSLSTLLEVTARGCEVPAACYPPFSRRIELIHTVSSCAYIKILSRL